MKHRIWDLDPAAYRRHALHCGERGWCEANCSVDLWIELLHTAGHEPIAGLPFVFAVDLEGDQWTFFKFPFGDLEALFGVDVIEMNVWRSLKSHVSEQLALERPSIVEVDAFYLPDTLGTSYRAEHVKTSIGIQALDDDERRLGYFHNAGYYELASDDFDGIFRLGPHAADVQPLPPYAEVVKLDKPVTHTTSSLRDASLALLRKHLRRRPSRNPFQRYQDSFSKDMAWLSGEPPASFHNYAFATLRQCGAAFELGAAYLRWLEAAEEQKLEAAIAACSTIAATAKVLQFKVARTLNTGKPLDAQPLLQTMATSWDITMRELEAQYGGR